MSIDTAPPSASSSQGRPRIASGTKFVIAAAVLAVGFVLFLVFASPLLLDRTLALAPPPAPQTVASGELEGRRWTAEAYDRAAGLRVPDEEGIEPVVEAEPCLAVDLGSGTDREELCVLRRGGSLRGMQAAVAPAGRALVYGIVAPQVSEVRLQLGAGQDLVTTPTYVDFGFPLGFFVVEVDAGTPVRGAVALSRTGVTRATAHCATTQTPFSACTFTEGDY